MISKKGLGSEAMTVSKLQQLTGKSGIRTRTPQGKAYVSIPLLLQTWYFSVQDVLNSSVHPKIAALLCDGALAEA